MVNYQTSQYELLNLLFFWSRLGVFQYIRDILQVTVSLDHPVPSFSDDPCHVLPHLLDHLLQLQVKAGLFVAHPGLGHLSVRCLE